MKMTMTKTLRQRHRPETRRLSAAVTFERDNATREEVGALLERLAHHVHAGILVGHGDAVPLPDELSVKVVVGPTGDDAMVRVSIGRWARKPYAYSRVFGSTITRRSLTTAKL